MYPRVAWPHLLGAWYRPSAAVREQQNSENRIGAGQSNYLRWPKLLPAALGERSVRLGRGADVIGSPGCWGEWRNGRRAGFTPGAEHRENAQKLWAKGDLNPHVPKDTGT